MADNTVLDAGSGGDTIASDDISGVKYPRSKIVIGADGSNDGDVSSANPLPALVTGAAAENAAVSGNPILVGARYDSSARTLGDGDVGALAVDADGALHISDGGNTITVDGTVTANLSETDNAVLDTIETNTDFGTVTGGGVEASALRVTIASDSTGVVSIDDGGGSLTVDGTVTANLSATDNAVLDTIETNTDFGTVTGGGVEASALRVTIANDSTGVLSVDDGGGTLTVDGTVTANLGATDNAVLDSIDTAVSGTLTVGGTAAHDAAVSGNPVLIGAEFDDTATDVVDEGDVGRLRINNRRSLYTTFETPAGDSPWDDTNDALQVNVVAGGGTGGTSETDDGAFTAGSGSGTPVMGFFSTDTVDSGDVGVLAMDTSRRLLVSIEADNAGIGGGTQYTEDDAAPTNPVGNALLAERDDALGGLTPIEGDWTHLYVNANGALWCKHDGDVTIADGGNSITVDGTVTANLSATDNAVLDTIETNTDFGAVVGGGAEATALRVTIANDSTGVVSVDDGGGTLTVDGTVTANAGTGTFTVQEATPMDVSAATVTVQHLNEVAHDAADAGNPLKVGAKAETALSGVTLVADGDRTDLHAGVDGVLITRPHTGLEDVVSGNASDTAGTSTSVIAAAGAGIKQYLTSFSLTNTSSTDTYCELKSGTTVMWRVPVPANGGVTHSFNVPLPPNAANEAWNFDMGAGVTTAYCSMVGFKSKV